MSSAERLIYIVDSRRESRDALSAQIGRYGYGARGFDTLRDAVGALAERRPGALLAEIGLNEGDTPMIMAEIQSMDDPPPIILMSEYDDVRVRLRAVRYGCREFFTRPVDMDRLIDRLDLYSQDPDEDPYRALVVESNPELAGELAAILSDANVITKVSLRPSLATESLIGFPCDLMLMNLYYPDVMGMELAAVIRQHRAFDGMPILFYSEEDNPHRRVVAMERGGDGFIAMPAEPEHIIAAVTSRMERARVQRRLMVTDSLTGLINHSRLRELLARELNRRNQEKAPLFALVDIDRFKRINDDYGHGAGDKVIRGLGRMLRQRAWSTDRVGRYGGAVFGVIIKSLGVEAAGRVFDEIRMDFSALTHGTSTPTGHKEFQASFSCGIAGARPGDTPSSLIERCEAALEAAKSRGGNRVAMHTK